MENKENIYQEEKTDISFKGVTPVKTGGNIKISSKN